MALPIQPDPTPCLENDQTPDPMAQVEAPRTMHRQKLQGPVLTDDAPRGKRLRGEQRSGEVSQCTMKPASHRHREPLLTRLHDGSRQISSGHAPEQVLPPAALETHRPRQAQHPLEEMVVK